MSETLFDLSLIVPCFNEEDNVQLFFDEVNRVFQNEKFTYEFIFVDDGSRDKTYLNLKKIYEDNPESNIQIISFSRNFGKEAAIYAGLQNSEGDYTCVIDADLQQRPEVVVQMKNMLDKISQA